MTDNLSGDVYLAEFSESPLPRKQRLQRKKGTQATLRPQGLRVIPLPQGSPRVVIEQNSPRATALSETSSFSRTWGQTLTPSHGPETLQTLLLLHLLPVEEGVSAGPRVGLAAPVARGLALTFWIWHIPSSSS